MRSVKLKVDEKLTEVNSSHITYTLCYKNQCYSSFVDSCIDIFFIIIIICWIFFCRDVDEERETYSIAEKIEIIGFLDIKDIGSPPTVARHLILPRPMKDREKEDGRKKHTLFLLIAFIDLDVKKKWAAKTTTSPVE